MCVVELATGDLVGGKFRVIRRLGRGAMGSVYLAQQQLIDRLVAVKVLHHTLTEDPAMLDRFQREAVATSKIRHPNVALVYDYGQVHDSVYLAMEYVDGETLLEAMRRLGRVPVPAAIDVATQVALALAAAHAEGILHRDVKPQNILLTSGADGTVAKVVDFGVAKLLDRPASVQTDKGLIVGTPQYMAPEQAAGMPIGPPADLYSLGIILYRMLEGNLPFRGTPQEIAVAHQKRSPPPLGDDVPFGLRKLVNGLLEKAPDRRPQTADDLTRSLLRCRRVETMLADATHIDPWGETTVGDGMLSAPTRDLPTEQLTDVFEETTDVRRRALAPEQLASTRKIAAADALRSESTTQTLAPPRLSRVELTVVVLLFLSVVTAFLLLAAWVLALVAHVPGP